MEIYSNLCLVQNRNAVYLQDLQWASGDGATQTCFPMLTAIHPINLNFYIIEGKKLKIKK
jgi:hypothetical protein